MRRISVILIAFLSMAASPIWFQERSLVRLTFSQEREDGQMGKHTCTGFMVHASRGLVLTAEHCVPKDDSVQLFADDEPVQVIKRSADLAIVQVEPFSRPALEIGGDVEILDPVIVIGYGYQDLHRFKRNVSTKEISDKKKKVDLECDLIGLDGPLAPGMSGGPILDAKMKVVGISQATAPAIGLGCNASELKRFIKEAK